jgi:hypothetical protein
MISEIDQADPDIMALQELDESEVGRLDSLVKAKNYEVG